MAETPGQRGLKPTLTFPPCLAAPPQEPFQAGFPHRARHCYVVSTTHKAYAIHAPQHQLFLLLAPHVPTFALRPLAARTLQRLTGDTAL